MQPRRRRRAAGPDVRRRRRKVADVAAQVEAQHRRRRLPDKDLATVMAGGNDILEIYSRFPATAESDLIAEAKARGLQLAGSVNRLVALGAKVVVSDVPDMGLTPYAAKQDRPSRHRPRRAADAADQRLQRAARRQRGARRSLRRAGAGRSATSSAIRRSPASFGLSDIDTAVCTVAPPNCTTSTLITGAAAAEYLWADDTRFAVGGQNQLASLAIDRARRNPF